MRVDPTGHFAITTAIILGLIGVGAVAGFGAVAYIDYSDDGQIFNGSVGWETYVGGTVLGGVIGGLIGYFAAPSIAGLLASSGTIGDGLAFAGAGGAIGSGIAISTLGELALAGTAVLTGTGTFGLTVMFVKGFGPRMGHNQHEKQMWNEAMRQLGINDKDLISRLHTEIHKYPYADKLKVLLKILREILEKWGY